MSWPNRKLGAAWQPRRQVAFSIDTATLHALRGSTRTQSLGVRYIEPFTCNLFVAINGLSNQVAVIIRLMPPSSFGAYDSLQLGGSVCVLDPTQTTTVTQAPWVVGVAPRRVETITVEVGRVNDIIELRDINGRCNLALVLETGVLTNDNPSLVPIQDAHLRPEFIVLRLNLVNKSLREQLWAANDDTNKIRTELTAVLEHRRELQREVADQRSKIKGLESSMFDVFSLVCDSDSTTANNDTNNELNNLINTALATANAALSGANTFTAAAATSAVPPAVNTSTIAPPGEEPVEGLKQLILTADEDKLIVVAMYLDRMRALIRDKMDEVVNCCVCFSAPRHLKFSPCGHRCCCTVCAYKVDSCPICRGPIESITP